MSLPATDSFTGTGALSGSWTVVHATPARASGVFQGGTGSDFNFAYWSGDSFTAAQYGQALLGAAVNSGIVLREDGVSDAYLALYNGASSGIYLLAANAGFVLLHALSGSPSVGDTIRFEIDSGYTMKVFINGAQDGSDYTEATHLTATGSPGLAVYATTATLDDFVANNGAGGGGGSNWGPMLGGQLNQIVKGD